MNEKEKFEEGITNIAGELVGLLVKKNTGYGNSFYKTLDKFKVKISTIGFKDSLLENMYLMGFWQRLHDKLERLYNLIGCQYDNKEENKRIIDVIKDIAGYCILMLNYLRDDNR